MDKIQIEVEVADSEYCPTCSDFELDYVNFVSRGFKHTRWYCTHYKTCAKLKEFLEREK